MSNFNSNKKTKNKENLYKLKFEKQILKDQYKDNPCSNNLLDILITLKQIRILEKTLNEDNI